MIASRSRQQGFVLVIVVIALVALSALALLLANTTSMDNALRANQVESDSLDYLTEAGMQHAKWQLAKNTSCTAYTDLPVTAFGSHSYSATVTPTAGSPVSVISTGTLANGNSRTLTHNDQKLFETAIVEMLQPDAAGGKDTYVYEWQSGRNFGLSGDLVVENRYSNSWSNALLEFDVSTIPVTAKIFSATLDLYQNSNSATGGDFSIHRASNPWVEGVMTGGNGSPNWIERDAGVGWATAGGDYSPTPVSSVSIPAGIGSNQWDVTALVQDWVSGGSPNQGMVIVPGSFGSNAFFSSSDDTDPFLRPKLTITYACECGVGGTAANDVLAATNDTYLATGSNANLATSNYGANARLTIGTHANVERSLLNFDLSGLPPGALITSALLELFYESSGTLSDGTIDVFRLDTSWVEMQATWGIPQIGQTWTGGSYDPTVIATAPVSEALTNSYIPFDVTSLAQSWHDGSASNQGMLLAARGGVAYGTGRFTSSNSSVISQQPKLTINYSCPCGVVCSGGGGGGTVYLDQFTSRNCVAADYIGSDGSLDWSSSTWVETADDGLSCSGGIEIAEDSVFIDPGNYRLVFNSANKVIERSINLSSFTTAWLSFDYRRENLLSGDELVLDIWDDASASWLELDRMSGPGNDISYQAVSLDISAYVSANSALRFTTIGTGPANQIYLDNIQIASTGFATSPIAHWKLDDAAGLTAVDSEGSNDGTLSGPPAWTTGNIDGALDFDGVDDYVDVGTFDVAGTGITMMGWFNAEVLDANDGRIVSKATGTAESDAWWQLSTTDVGTDHYLSMRIKAGGTTTTLTDSSVKLSTSRWYFAVATYDNTSGNMKLYLDGVEVASAAHAVGGVLDTDAAVPVAIGANGTAERFFDGILDDVRVYNYAISGAEISNLFAANPPPAPPGYTETYQPWSATVSDSWEAVDLAVFGVPANAVVEVAVVNNRFNAQRWGGVRAFGSTLDRRLQLREAEAGGTDVMVMHVQADADSRIEHYSDVTTNVSFILLGYWGAVSYTEKWDVFNAGTSASWVARSLGGYGVPADSIVEVVVSNGADAAVGKAGVRGGGTSNPRFFDIEEAEGGGLDTLTLFAQADATVQIDVYAEPDANIGFYLAGYWSTPPGTYTETGGVSGQVTEQATWQQTDLSSFGIPANSVAQFVISNEEASTEAEIGVRATGSALNRVLDLQEAESGGVDAASMHVSVDGAAQVEWYIQSGIPSRIFYPVGWWTLSP